uniref:Smr domain-containing protein n=1 Tax=Romanomermis culicivorax TaxID=13658 RepID=A0A915HG38_ROMCU
MFRELDKETLGELLKINDFNLQSTIEILCDTLNISPNEKQKLLSSIQTPKLEQPSKLPTTSTDYETDDFEDLSYENLRSEALYHYEERKKFFDQAQLAFRKKMPGAASYYAQIGRMHDAKLKNANAVAAQKLMNFRTRHDPPDTIDLHGLHVQEAISALSQKLKEFENRSGKQVNIITGSGKHSFFGAAKIKPAVIAYLSRKRMTFSENNGGLIQVIIK